MNRKSELASAVATLKAKANGGVPRVGQVGLTDKTLYLNVSCKGQGGTIQLVDVNTKRLTSYCIHALMMPVVATRLLV